MESRNDRLRTSAPSVRQVAAVVAGNALEFYDFLTYAFFAVYIGKAFFPASDPTTSLLASLGAFGAGFITRPIGGFVIGTMGDRLGRRPAMIFSFSLMGVAIAGLALTPSYGRIGIAAPVLVIAFRLLQGFALGGEVGPTTAFLMEASPPNRRGFYTTFQYWTQSLATLTAGLIGFGLASILNPQELQSFGWRIALLAGAAIAPFALVLRRNLPETFFDSRGERERISWRPYISVAVLGVMMLASATISVYIATYMTTYAIATLHMPAAISFGATIVAGSCGVAFDLVSGAISDRIGRKTMMLIPGVLLLAAIFPAFSLLTRYRTPLTLLGATGVLAGLTRFSVCPMIVWLTESFPPEMRSGGVAIIYAISIATFGGSAQYVVTWLIHITGNPIAPAWYWTGAVIVGLAAMILSRETAPSKIPRTTSPL